MSSPESSSPHQNRPHQRHCRRAREHATTAEGLSPCSSPQKSMSPHHRAHSRTGELIAEPENPSPCQRASSSPHRTRQHFSLNSYFLFLNLCLIFQSSVNRNSSLGLRASHQEAFSCRARGLDVAELVASGCCRRPPHQTALHLRAHRRQSRAHRRTGKSFVARGRRTRHAKAHRRTKAHRAGGLIIKAEGSTPQQRADYNSMELKQQRARHFRQGIINRARQ